METKTKTRPVAKTKAAGFQRITPFLWFDNQAEEAVAFYTSTFINSARDFNTYYSKSSANASGSKEGSVMTVSFHLEGQEFVAINGGPVFRFNPAVSLFVNCDTEGEIDRLWKKLSDHGSVLMELSKYPFAEKYGWLTDRFGLSWQLFLGPADQKISPCLMFTGDQAGKAEKAVTFYSSVFRDSASVRMELYKAGEAGGKPGMVKHARFTIGGMSFIAMDSQIEHQFGFNPAISFVVNCETQKDIDYFWDKLTRGGDEKAQMCGWLADKFGVAWQIVPAVWEQMLHNATPQKSDRMMQEILKMKKLDLPTLEKVYRE